MTDRTSYTIDSTLMFMTRDREYISLGGQGRQGEPTKSWFRTIKDNRDYLKGRSANWLYMSRIASLKEFAFMQALYKRGFPTPTPYDANRHGIVMSLVQAYPMVNIKGLVHPEHGGRA